jgi:hypothetical protein
LFSSKKSPELGINICYFVITYVLYFNRLEETKNLHSHIWFTGLRIQKLDPFKKKTPFHL